LIPTFGWKGVFVFGGVFPLLLTPIVWLWMPESLRFMAGKPRYQRESRQVLQRLTGDADTPIEEVIPEEANTNGVRENAVGTLFSQRYRTGTLLLWLAFFCTLWVYYQVSSWLPTVITGAGIEASHAARVGAMLPLGGTIGSLINARLMDRMNPFYVLAGSYAVAAVSIALIGVSINEPTWVYVTVFMAGLGLSGAQTGANVLVAGFYTTAARATGVSWALGVGRIGSIIGSMTGGVLLAAFHTADIAFVVFAAPVVIAGVAMLANGWVYRGRDASQI
jgi:AAHS family 4-hydroxybenzoate transporter-like MFS transporter